MQDHRIPVPLGIEGLRVTSCREGDLGLEVGVETIAQAGVCPDCHGVALVPKERPVVVVRDLSIQGVPTYLVWRKRRYACPDCSRSFTESCAEIPPRARVTRRYERHLYGAVAHGSSILRVARDEEVTFYRVQLAFSKGAQGALALRPPAAPRVLGIDEAAHKKGQDYNTVVTDPAAREVLEVLRGRDGKSLQSWLSALPAGVRAGIAAVAIDMWAPYRRVARACLPEATVVCDKFHLVRIVGQALDRVRRRLQRRHGSTRRTSGWQPALFRLRHALLADPARLRPEKRAELPPGAPRRSRAPHRLPPLPGLPPLLRRGHRRDRAGAAASLLPRGRALRAPRVQRALGPWPAPLGAGDPRLLRDRPHQRLHRGRDEQGEGDQARRLRLPQLRALQRACARAVRSGLRWQRVMGPRPR